MRDEPKAYQNDGIDFLAARDTALLGDDAGLGKSLQLIRAADKIGANRIIVGCPAIGRVSWRDQLGQWQTRPRQLVFWPSKDPIPSGPVALIVTYDWLARPANLKELIGALAATDPFDVAIMDEVHYLKTPSANRTKAVYGPRLDGYTTRAFNSLAGRVQRVWIASATPQPNNATELYAHIKALFPQVLVQLFGKVVPLVDFRDRFCLTHDTPFGVRVNGNNRLTIPELKIALAPHVLVRKKGDVLQDLDPIRCVSLPFEIEDDDPHQFVDAALNQTLNIAEACGMESDDDQVFQSLRTLALGSDHIATRRRALGMLKVTPAVEWIDNLLRDPTKKLIVFAHHRDVIETLRQQLAHHSPVALFGGVAPALKDKIVQRFQTDPAVRVFIGQTHAAGTSITLTAAQDVLLLEPDWTPIYNYQAISRAHRIGQKGSVTAWFASAANTIDERIGRALRRKAADAAQLFGENPGGHLEQTG